MINLKTKNNNYLAEIFQSLEVKFELCNKIDKDHYEQLHTEVKCRDFLGDCIWSKKTKKPVSIYGFQYDFSQDPYKGRKLRLSMKFPKTETKKIFLENLPKLHEKETQANVTKSTILETTQENTIILESSSKWLDSMWKISLFTFYLKCFSYENVTELLSPENKYNEKLTKEKENLFLSKIKDFKKELLPSYISDAHNSSGFYSILISNNAIMNSLILGENNAM